MVTLIVPPWWVEVIPHHLEALGFCGLWIDPDPSPSGGSMVRCYLPDEDWRPLLLRELQARLGELSRLLPADTIEPQVDVRTIPEEDWAANWLPFFVPFKEGNIWIRPSAKTVPLADGEREIVIDPGQAFGTGHHESTRLCLGAIRRLRPHLSDHAAVLDLGTGTGILAMFSCRVGLRNLTAVDVDSVAVETARENLKRNGVAETVRLAVGSLDTFRISFDLILANLSFTVLKGLAGELARRVSAGGWVVLSGVLKDEVIPLSRVFSARGFTPIDRVFMNEWGCLIGQRQNAVPGCMLEKSSHAGSIPADA